jgi:hypothetical protein
MFHNVHSPLDAVKLNKSKRMKEIDHLGDTGIDEKVILKQCIKRTKHESVDQI